MSTYYRRQHAVLDPVPSRRSIWHRRILFALYLPFVPLLILAMLAEDAWEQIALCWQAGTDQRPPLG